MEQADQMLAAIRATESKAAWWGRAGEQLHPGQVGDNPIYNFCWTPKAVCAGVVPAGVKGLASMRLFPESCNKSRCRTSSPK